MVGVFSFNFFDNKTGKYFGGLQIASPDGLHRFGDGVLNLFRTKINYLPVPSYYFRNHI